MIKNRVLKAIKDGGHFEAASVLKTACDFCGVEAQSEDGATHCDFTEQLNRDGFRVVNTKHCEAFACAKCLPEITEDATL